MKSVLLHANQDNGLESRLQAALDVVRLFDGHLTCLHTTPYEAFIAGDPFGGVYALPVVVDQLKRLEDEQRARLDAALANEGVQWDWLQIDGPSLQAILDRSRLADLVVLSLAAEGDDDEPALSLAASVAIHGRAPVLAVPRATSGFDPRGPAMVAWNGSPEAAHALRFALPMLGRASEVHIVTVTEDCLQFPAVEGCEYLSRHGIRSELREWPREGRRVGEALTAATASLGARYLVMGAYGHSRLREAVLGGVTRDMMRQSRVPLLLGH